MADMGLTEVSAAIMKEVSTFVQAELKQRSVLMPLVQNFTAAPGRDTIKIPRGGGFTAGDKAENTALTAQVITFATDDLILNLHKAILVRLEEIAQIQATPDVVGEILGRMAREMALQIDKDIFAQLELTIAAAPDHRLAYADTVSLKKADILNARELLHIQNIEFNECYIGVHPSSEKSLLAVDDFVHVDKYGSAAPIQRGELGRLYGAPVIMSNVFAVAKTVVWHPTHVALGLQQNLLFRRDFDMPNVAEEFLGSQIYGVQVLDEGKRGVLLGSAA